MSDPLRIVVWPGMPDRAGLDRAAEAIGRRLEIAVISANEDLERLLEREGPWDLITPSDYLVEKLAAAGRLAELDPRGELDRDQLAGWSRRPGYDPEERWSWPLAFGTTGLLYDRAAVESPSWAAFFAPADGVAVGLLAEVREVVGAALIARGHSPNAADPAALAAARELLDRQRPAVRSVSSDDFTGPVNLGNPVEMPIRHLAETVLKLVGGKSKLVQARPLPVDDPLQRCPDITLAREKLQWEPKVPLEEGLQKTIAYFDELLRGNEQVSRVGR